LGEEVMGRTYIRPTQMRDEDLLTESEHLNWDHSTISGVPRQVITLEDTPNDYDDGKYLRSTTSGLEWSEASGVGGTFVGLTDTPEGYYQSSSTTSGTDSADLLIQSNHADESTSITDSSSNQITLELAGDVQHDTDQSKIGASSIYFDGNADYISGPDGNTAFEFGTGDFTIEAYVRFSSTAGIVPIISCGRGVCAGVRQLTWLFYYENGNLYFYRYDGSETSYSRSWSPVTGTWYHLVACRESSILRFFVDGSQQGSDISCSTNYSLVDYDGDSDVLFIGTVQTGGGCGTANYFNGWMDEIRVVKGSAEFTTTFTPPTESYVPIGESSPGYTYYDKPQTLVINDANDGLEYKDFDFVALNDTPSDYDDGKYLRSTASGIEYYDTIATTSGYSGEVEVYTDVNFTTNSGIKGYMTFENGLLTSYSGSTWFSVE
jgi:hypothetical protein